MELLADDDYASGTEAFLYDLAELTERGMFDFDSLYSMDEPTPVTPLERQTHGPVAITTGTENKPRGVGSADRLFGHSAVGDDAGKTITSGFDAGLSELPFDLSEHGSSVTQAAVTHASKSLTRTSIQPVMAVDLNRQTQERTE